MRRLLRPFKRGLSFLESQFRRSLRFLLRGVMRCRTKEWPAGDLGRSAIVFAPHQDDEALGCGGTIIQKRRARADVKIVFVTDGSMSHPALMPPEQMRAIRAEEAVAAAKVLGVERPDVIFLDFKDGQLTQNQEPAVEKVAEILRRERPAEVFIPYYADGPQDHWATTRIVLAALEASRHEATVYEYLIWYWCQWPWTGLPGSRWEILRDLKAGLAANGRLLRDFRCFVRIGDVLDLKREALDRHASQVKRYRPDTQWFTLGDVWNGEFLDCFFQKREIFYRHPVPKA
jgi:LmbE family N-acetylglucosaminyl deacetylase